jgi:hypothetical protein
VHTHKGDPALAPAALLMDLLEAGEMDPPAKIPGIEPLKPKQIQHRPREGPVRLPDDRQPVQSRIFCAKHALQILQANPFSAAIAKERDIPQEIPEAHAQGTGQARNAEAQKLTPVRFEPVAKSFPGAGVAQTGAKFVNLSPRAMA